MSAQIYNKRRVGTHESRHKEREQANCDDEERGLQHEVSPRNAHLYLILCGVLAFVPADLVPIVDGQEASDDRCNEHGEDGTPEPFAIADPWLVPTEDAEDEDVA